MGCLKRKRSFDSSTPSSSASSSPQATFDGLASPPPAFAFGSAGAFASQGFVLSNMDIDRSELPRSFERFGELDSGRTRKRWRDDRPNEEAIHRNTLNMLFEAQRTQLPTAPPSPCPEVNLMEVDMDMDTPAPPPSPQNHQQDQRQMTLHSFWRISSSVAPQVTTKPVLQDQTMGDAQPDMPQGDWYTDVPVSQPRKQHNAITLNRWFSPAPAF